MLLLRDKRISEGNKKLGKWLRTFIWKLVSIWFIQDMWQKYDKQDDNQIKPFQFFSEC